VYHSLAALYLAVRRREQSPALQIRGWRLEAG